MSFVKRLFGISDGKSGEIFTKVSDQTWVPIKGEVINQVGDNVSVSTKGTVYNRVSDNTVVGRDGSVFNSIGDSMSSDGSIRTGVIATGHSDGFEDAIRNAVSIGGDSTIAAIAGGIAEVLYGMPDDLASKVWGYLPPDMKVVLVDSYSQVKI
jgi:ADP-ribosylglycohydrolase